MTSTDHRKPSESDTAAKVRLAAHMLDYFHAQHKDLETTIPEIVYKMSLRTLTSTENENPASKATTSSSAYLDPRIVSWPDQTQAQTSAQTLSLSPRNITREGYELIKSALRPRKVEPFDLWGCFHTAVLNVQNDYTTGVINKSHMFTMVRNSFISGAVGRSQERLTTAQWADIYAAETEEEEEEKEKDEDENTDSLTETNDQEFDEDYENDEEDVEEELIYEIHW